MYVVRTERMLLDLRLESTFVVYVRYAVRNTVNDHCDHGDRVSYAPVRTFTERTVRVQWDDTESDNSNETARSIFNRNPSHASYSLH